MNSTVHVSWTGVAAAVAVFFVLGGIWFPVVVSRAYVVALGREMKSGTLSLVGPLACLTMITITDSALIDHLQLHTYTEVAGFGLVIGIGYLTPMIVNISLNPLFPKPFLYSAINAPFFVVGNVLASIILVVMS